MKEIKDILKEHSFFKDIPDDKLAYVAGCGQNMHFGPGEYLGREGEPADTLFLIKKGRVAVQISHPTRGVITIHTPGADEIAGFSWIIPPYRLQFDLLAVDHTSVVAFNGKCLRGKCEEDHHLGYLMMKRSATVMLKRIQETRMQLLDVYSERV